MYGFLARLTDSSRSARDRYLWDVCEVCDSAQETVGGVMAPDPDTPQARGDAAATLPVGGPGTGRAGLDQRRILGAAVQFIDEHGLRALTMQRLGAYLGVEGMAIYR